MNKRHGILRKKKGRKETRLTWHPVDAKIENDMSEVAAIKITMVFKCLIRTPRHSGFISENNKIKYSKYATKIPQHQTQLPKESWTKDRRRGRGRTRRRIPKLLSHGGERHLQVPPPPPPALPIRGSQQRHLREVLAKGHLWMEVPRHRVQVFLRMWLAWRVAGWVLDWNSLQRLQCVVCAPGLVWRAAKWSLCHCLGPGLKGHS